MARSRCPVRRMISIGERLSPHELESTMNTIPRILAPLFAVVILTGGGAWFASARADAANGSAIESDAYEYDYLPSQLVDPARAYGEHIETF